MNTDTATTVTGTVTALSGIGAALAAIMPNMGIDPSLIALLPPPYNLYVALGLIGVMAISHIVQSVMTNKRTMMNTSDMQQFTPGPDKK